MTQKYFAGDLVYVAADLGLSMRYFENDQQAIVLYTYSEKYGSSAQNDKEYCLYLLKSKTEVSWYHEHQLSFIEPDRFDLLPKNHIARHNYDAKKERDSKIESYAFADNQVIDIFGTPISIDMHGMN